MSTDGRMNGRTDGPKTIVPFDLQRGTMRKNNDGFKVRYLQNDKGGGGHVHSSFSDRGSDNVQYREA